MWTLKFLLAYALLLGVPGAVSAQPLSSYSAERDALFNLGDRVSLAGFGPLLLEDLRFGSIEVDASGTPSPSLQARSTIGPNDAAGIFGRGSALLNYQVEVVGPAGTVPVRVDVRGSASGSATAGASFAVESFWSIFLDIGRPLGGDDIRSGQIFGADSFARSFDRTVDLMLVANLPYTVSMLADAQAAATDAESRASAQALVDPVFSFGAGVDPALYSLELSPGIGNAAAVPEPAAFVSMSLGLLMLGAALHGRKKRPRTGGPYLRRA